MITVYALNNDQGKLMFEFINRGEYAEPQYAARARDKHSGKFYKVETDHLSEVRRLAVDFGHDIDL